MSSDNTSDPKELERRKLLEEIRRRAEEAELKRIEEEEESAPPVVSQDEDLPTAKSPPQRPVHAVPPVKEIPVDEHRLIELRGEFAIAIDHENLDDASDTLLELAQMIPGSVELASYEGKLRSLRKRLQERVTRPAPPPPPPVEQPAGDKERKSREKKIAALLERAVSLYEQEKYDQADVAVQELRDLDPDHEEAAELHERIRKARELADAVRAEETRQRAEDEAEGRGVVIGAEEPAPPQKDFWGSGGTSHGDPEYGMTIEGDASAEPPSVPVVRKLVETASRIRIPVKPLLIAAAVVVVVLVGYYVSERIQQAAGELTSSVLVLPGWYSPSDSMAEFLATSIAERVSGNLSRVKGLRVIAPQSATALRYLRGGPAVAARSLGVVNYLHWNIKTTPADVRMELTLRDTLSSEPLWNETKTSSVRELPTAIAEITSAILNHIDLSGSVDDVTAASLALTQNPDALLSYFRGRSMLGAPERVERGDPAVLFEQALQTDPDFSAARVSLAWAKILQYEASSRSLPGLHDEISLLSRTGVESTGPSAGAMLVQGVAEQMNGRYQEALLFFETAAKSFPGDAEAQRRYARALLMVGKSEESLKAAERAAELDPLNLSSFTTLGFIRQYMQEYNPALETYRAGMQYAPDKAEYAVRHYPELLVSLQQHDSAEAILSNAIAQSREDYVLYYRLGRVYQSAGKPLERWGEIFDRSKDLIERRLRTAPSDGIAQSYLALVMTRLGRYKEANAALDRALRMERKSASVLYNAARAYAMQRESELALEYLDKAVGLKYDPDMILDLDLFNLRQERDFLNVVTR